MTQLRGKLVICTLVVLTVLLYCLSLLLVLRVSLPVTPEERYNGISAAKAVPLRLLHSNVTRDLVDGRLPLDPNDNQSWSIFQEDSPEHPCSQYKTRFGLDTPRVWLVSFPRSGNTWTRYLLEAASGVFTGSVYTGPLLFKAGYLGEKDDLRKQRTLVQKTHLHSIKSINETLDRRFSMASTSVPTILLLRNPAKAVLSFYKYMKNRRHPSKIPASAYKSEEFRIFVRDKVKQWMEMALDRLLWTEAPLYVMHYERLLEDPIREITALLAFLGVPRDEGRLTCLSLQLQGTFKSEESKPANPYTKKEKQMMTAGTRAVNRTLLLLGYPPLPTY